MLKIDRIEECGLLYGYELPADQRAEYDYMDDDDYECNEFFRYRNDFYCLDQFMKIGNNNPFGDFWHAYHSDSAFSGILIHCCKEGDGVIAATYMS